MNNILEDSICYLVGAIDNAIDQGKGWRRDLIKQCKDRNIKIKFLDPTNKIGNLKAEVDEEQTKIRALKQNSNWEELSEMMSKIVRHDHRSQDISDFIILKIDTHIHMCGSYFELQSALTQKKPYFIIVEGGKKNTPNWLFGIANHEYFFDSVTDVVNKLEQINNGSIEIDDRWVLFRKDLSSV